MEEINLINRYLKAFVANVNDELIVSELISLQNVFTVLCKDKKTVAFLKDQFVSKKEKNKLLSKCLEKDNKRINNFFNILCQKGRIHLVEEFLIATDLFIKNYEIEKRVDIHICTDTEEPVKKLIQKYIEKKINSPIVANYYVNDLIMGGFIAYIGHTKIDCSVKNLLNLYETKVLNTN